jgi:hypothetical protein
MCQEERKGCGSVNARRDLLCVLTVGSRSDVETDCYGYPTGLLNLRGQDIPFNPVFFSFLYLPTSGSPTLFIDIDQLTEEAYRYLEANNVLIEPYEDVLTHLKKIGEDLKADVRWTIHSSLDFSLT